VVEQDEEVAIDDAGASHIIGEIWRWSRRSPLVRSTGVVAKPAAGLPVGSIQSDELIAVGEEARFLLAG